VKPHRLPRQFGDVRNHVQHVTHAHFESGFLQELAHKALSRTLAELHTTTG
jgi:hypothetical protein